MANLREKLVAVMSEVYGVAKAGRNTQGAGYDYQKAADIFPKVQKALTTHKIAFMAHEVGREFPPPHESRSGGAVFVSVVTMRYSFHDAESDEVLSGEGSGLAFDSSDKALNKAKTAALKYFLKQTLLLAEADDDPDAETIEVKHKQNTAGSMRAVDDELGAKHNIPIGRSYAEMPLPPSNHPAAGTPISVNHAKEIRDWCDTNNIDFMAVFGDSFGVVSPHNLTEEQYEIWRNTKLVTLNNYNAKHAGIEKAHKLVSETHQRMAAQAQSTGPLRLISEKQVGRLFAIAGGPKEPKHPAHDRREIIRHVLSQHGIESDRDIPVSRYEAICEEVAKAAE